MSIILKIIKKPSDSDIFLKASFLLSLNVTELCKRINAMAKYWKTNMVVP